MNPVSQLSRSIAHDAFASVTVVLLCGGLGMRLQSVIADRPKALAQVRRRPFLDQVLQQVRTAGVCELVFCTGHLGDQIERTYRDALPDVDVKFSREHTPLGTGGALRLAAPRCSYDTLMVMNGDSFCDVSLPAFLQWHRGRGAHASVVIAPVPDTSRYGRIECAEDGRIVRFEEKGQGSGPGWINAGIYLLARERVLGLPEHCALSLERDVFPEWLAQGLFAFCGSERFLDIGTPESYARAEEFFATPETILA